MSNENQQPRKLSPWREKLHLIIFGTDTKSGKAFDVGLIIAIFLSVLVVILSTLDAADEKPYKTIFYALEWVFTILFTIEYISWLSVAPFATRHPSLGSLISSQSSLHFLESCFPVRAANGS